MNSLFLAGLLIVNFGISWWNAYAAGKYLTESKAMGTWFRVLTWSVLIMSMCGFTWVYLTILTLLSLIFNILPVEAAEAMFKLGYLIIIGPVIGSGLTIGIDSLATAWRTKKFGDIGIAGWNTYAQANNIWEASRNAPGFAVDVWEFFKSDDDEAADTLVKAIVIGLVIVALCSGIMTTMQIARRSDKKVSINLAKSHQATTGSEF